MKLIFTSLILCCQSTSIAAEHPAIEAITQMQSMMPDDVKNGNIEKWVTETLAKQEEPMKGVPHILVLGDSWADIVGMKSVNKNGKVSFLQNALNSHNCTATSRCLAIPGSTADFWAGKLLVGATKLAVKAADYVYIMLMGNDALSYLHDCAKQGHTAQQCSDGLLNTVMPDMYKIVDAIHAANPKARIVGFGYDTMFGPTLCKAVTHYLFPQCWKSGGGGNRCFNTHFLRIQEAWETIAANRSFVDKASILGATQVAGGDAKASTDPKNRHIDMDQMGPAQYWPVKLACFHPSVENCVPGQVKSCGAHVVMEEFYKDYWSKQPSVCPSAAAQTIVV